MTKGERLGISSYFALGIGAASFFCGDVCWSRMRMLESDAEFGSETVSKQKKI